MKRFEYNPKDTREPIESNCNWCGNATLEVADIRNTRGWYKGACIRCGSCGKTPMHIPVRLTYNHGIDRIEYTDEQKQEHRNRVKNHWLSR